MPAGKSNINSRDAVQIALSRFNPKISASDVRWLLNNGHSINPDKLNSIIFKHSPKLENVSELLQYPVAQSVCNIVCQTHRSPMLSFPSDLLLLSLMSEISNPSHFLIGLHTDANVLVNACCEHDVYH